jgi:DNA repair protein RadC
MLIDMLQQPAKSANRVETRECNLIPERDPEPSRADEVLTTTLKSALNLLDARVLDHIVVAGSQCVSFAERGLI